MCFCFCFMFAKIPFVSEDCECLIHSDNLGPVDMEVGDPR